VSEPNELRRFQVVRGEVDVVIVETSEGNALIRYLARRSVEATIGIDGRIIYSNPRNEKRWGQRHEWSVVAIPEAFFPWDKKHDGPGKMKQADKDVASLMRRRRGVWDLGPGKGVDDERARDFTGVTGRRERKAGGNSRGDGDS